MANIFNSNEIYIHIPHSVHGKETLVPINGLYVVGEYRPPCYIDGHLHISELQSTKAVIKNYTEAEVSLPDYTFNILPIEIDVDTPITVDYYTVADHSETDYVFNILPVEVDTSTPATIDYYTTNDVDISDYTFHILPIEVDVDTEIELTYYTRGYFGSMSESCIRIRTLESVKAQITDVTT